MAGITPFFSEDGHTSISTLYSSLPTNLSIPPDPPHSLFFPLHNYVDLQGTPAYCNQINKRNNMDAQLVSATPIAFPDGEEMDKHKTNDVVLNTKLEEAPPRKNRKRDKSCRGKEVREEGGEGGNKQNFVLVRARRGQATDRHSIAERVRREKIRKRMRFLQDLVPGCCKANGKTVVLDEIINYVKSLQNQIEFLSMKLCAASLYQSQNELDQSQSQSQSQNQVAYEGAVGLMEPPNCTLGMMEPPSFPSQMGAGELEGILQQLFAQ